ncbi:MAG TPA: GNAT family N-acetyltransferase [Gaiellaceae bacterium]|nr:GNAT family N-acetyltransferase [Gaiellaceae bacterium]
MELRVQIARTVEEIEALRSSLAVLPWEREEAELDSFLVRLAARPTALGPYAIVVFRGDEPVAGLIGRLESRRLNTNVGYRVVYAPRVRILQIVDGGVVAIDAAARSRLVSALGEALARGDAEVAALPPLEGGSELSRQLSALGGPLERQRFVPLWTRRRLVLAESFDAFLASRSWETRRGIKKTANRLRTKFGDEMRVEVLREPESLDRLVHDLDRIASLTYHRAVGAGFADTPEHRELARIGLEKGRTRAYVLYHGEVPIAYWLSSVYGGTMYLQTTGFDNAYSSHRVGNYLLMRLFEDAFADPAIDVIDFGPGDADYKRLYTNDGVRERNLFIFAPTFRARRINLTRTAILGFALVARRVADATHATDRVKALWRKRLREAA